MTWSSCEGYSPYKDTHMAAASWEAGKRLNLTASRRYPTFAFSISWFACGRASVSPNPHHPPHQLDRAGQGCHGEYIPQQKAADIQEQWQSIPLLHLWFQVSTATTSSLILYPNWNETSKGTWTEWKLCTQELSVPALAALYSMRPTMKLLFYNFLCSLVVNVKIYKTA